MSTGNAAVVPTDPFHGYQVIFSPYSSSKLAFAGSSNYGIAGEDSVSMHACRAWIHADHHALVSRPSTVLFAGKGALILYEEVRGHAGFREVNRYPWNDCLFDVTWSEVSEAVLVAASGDGSLVVVDQGIVGQPAAILRGHTAEVYYIKVAYGRALYQGADDSMCCVDVILCPGNFTN